MFSIIWGDKRVDAKMTRTEERLSFGLFVVHVVLPLLHELFTAKFRGRR